MKQAICIIAGYYLVVFKTLFIRSFKPKKAKDIPAWSLTMVFKLWNKQCRIEGDTFSQYLIRSGVNLPDIICRHRIIILLFVFCWPLIALNIISKHKTEKFKQWVQSLKRPDLYATFPFMKFTEQAINERRSDVFFAIINSYDFNTNPTNDYAIEDKKIFAERSSKAGLPLIKSLSLNEAEIYGGAFIVKDPSKDMGLGIKFAKTFSELKEIYKKENDLIQPILQNHSVLLDILPPNPPLCTLRLLTTILKDKPICHIAYFRIGSSDSLVDNVSRGGALAEVEIESGTILHALNAEACKGKEELIKIEKIDGAKLALKNLKLPYFSESVELVKKAHSLIAPNILSIGWDIALTDDGPVIVEANVFAGSYEVLSFNNSYSIGNQAILDRLNLLSTSL